MMPSESTQKMLPDDTYIVLLPKMAMGHDAIIAIRKYSKNAYQKGQWDMMPSESTQKMLPDDTYIVLLPKMAMGHDAIFAM